MHIAKSILVIVMSFCYLCSYSQLVDNKLITNRQSGNLFIETNYSNIELRSWGRNDIKIESETKINGDNHNEGCILDIRNAKNGVFVDAYIDTEALTKKVIVNNKDGSKSYFDFDKYNENQNEENDNVTTNIGYNIESKIVIWVPEEMNVKTSSVYGEIKSKGSFANLIINSTYGVIEAVLSRVDKMERLELFSTYNLVDLTIDPKANANLYMSTTYGEIYSDLKLDSTSMINENQTLCDKKYKINDGGVLIHLVSTYQNIYVRSKDS